MTKTEQVYGGSLYELASEEGLTGQIMEELRQVIAIFDANPDYWRFLSTLSIAKDERCKALDEAFGGKIQPYLLNFMKILCENGTMGGLKGWVAETFVKSNARADVVTQSSGLNVRSGRGTNYRIYYSIPHGTHGITVYKINGNWAYVSWNGRQKGWASLSYLRWARW